MADTELTDQQKVFIYALLENGGVVSRASEEAGFSKMYGYELKNKLADHIVKAAQQYLAMHSVRAASQVVDSIDKTMPNPVNLQAALALLDRVGVVKKDGVDASHAIKANVFILPAKDNAEESL